MAVGAAEVKNDFNKELKSGDPVLGERYVKKLAETLDFGNGKNYSTDIEKRKKTALRIFANLAADLQANRTPEGVIAVYKNHRKVMMESGDSKLALLLGNYLDEYAKKIRLNRENPGQEAQAIYELFASNVLLRDIDQYWPKPGEKVSQY